MSDAIPVQRDPVPPVVAPATNDKALDPARPDPFKEGETPRAERDPVLDLVQRLHGR